MKCYQCSPPRRCDRCERDHSRASAQHRMASFYCGLYAAALEEMRVRMACVRVIRALEDASREAFNRDGEQVLLLTALALVNAMKE